MISAILLCAMAQVQATVSLDPVPACPTCNALTARVAALEAQLSARTVTEPVRRVRLIPMSDAPPTTSGSGCMTVINYPDPVPAVAYSTPSVVTYRAPLGAALPSLAAWSPGSYVVPSVTYASPGSSYTSASYVERRGLFGGRIFGGRFMATSVSACGPGGCP